MIKGHRFDSKPDSRITKAECLCRAILYTLRRVVYASPRSTLFISFITVESSLELNPIKTLKTEIVLLSHIISEIVVALVALNLTSYTHSQSAVQRFIGLLEKQIKACWRVKEKKKGFLAL